MKMLETRQGKYVTPMTSQQKLKCRTKIIGMIYITHIITLRVLLLHPGTMVTFEPYYERS
jgi:hypothetical protein